MIRVLVPTGERYLPCLEAMLGNLRRQWDPLPPVTVFSERRLPVPEWAAWGAEYEEAAGAFSNRLRALLLSVAEPVVYLSPCDVFLLDDLDAQAAGDLAEYILERGDVARAAVLEPIEPHEYVETWRGLEIVRCAEWRDCSILAGMSMNPALWSRDLLRDLLEPGWDIWQVEQVGTYRMRDRFPEMRSVGVRPPLARCANLACREARATYPELLPPEDRALVPEGWNPWR
jgi:hypothetical protein